MNNRVILIQPSYPSSPFSGPHWPIGLGYLAEQLTEARIDYEVVDMNIDDFDSLQARIFSFVPDFLAISLMSLDITHNYNLISKIKNFFPLIKIIAGGPHISFVKAEALSDCPAIDFGIIQEGEGSLIKLISGYNITEIRGLIYRIEKEIKYNSDGHFIENLDKYPFPMYKKFDLSKYGRRIDIISSRGCPFNCIFCGAYLSMGKKWRARSAASLITEIDFWCNNGYSEFNFVDSNFFFDRQRVLEFCSECRERNLNITLSADGMRAEDADPEMLQMMKKCGLKSVAIGVESANEEILKNIKKGETLLQIKKAISTCLDLDLDVVLFFIIGLPGETKKSIEKSFEFALRYLVSEVYFLNANPIPGTELYSWAEENRYLLASRDDVFKNIGGMGDRPLITTPELDYDERRRLYEKGLLISKKVKITACRRKRIQRLKKFLNDIRIRILLRLFFPKNIKEKMANQIFTHLTHREKIFLKHMARKVPADGIIVELGSYLGASASFLALGAGNKGQRIYCVDTWHNDAMSEGKRDVFDQFKRNIARFKNKIFAMRGKSIELSKTFNYKIDLLFIDGDHTFEGCSADIRAWFPYLNKNAIVIFHDYNWAEGVQRAVKEFVKPIEKRPGRRFENIYWTIT